MGNEIKLFKYKCYGTVFKGEQGMYRHPFGEWFNADELDIFIALIEDRANALLRAVKILRATLEKSA